MSDTENANSKPLESEQDYRIIEVECYLPVQPEWLMTDTLPGWLMSIIPRWMLSPFLKNVSAMSEEWRTLRQKLLGKILKAEKTFSYDFGEHHEFVTGVSIERSEGAHRFITLYFSVNENLIEIARELEQFSFIKRAVPVPRVGPPQAPVSDLNLGTSDTLASGIETQWYIFRCNINEAWKTKNPLSGNPLSGQGAVIAIVDAGFKLDHQEFRSRQHPAFNALTNNSAITIDAHGTGVLGLIGAEKNNKGIIGIAYGAEFWVLQGGIPPGASTHENKFWRNAIQAAIEKNSNGKPRVLLIELETKSETPLENGRNIESIPSFNEVIKQAIKRGIIVCIPAGNGNHDAGLDHLGQAIDPTDSILVAATEYADHSNPKASASNWGERITVSAPGDPAHDLTCDINNAKPYTSLFGGTSGASAKVAGVIALMLEANSKLTHEKVKEILHSSGSPLNSDKPIGTFLNAEEAVRKALLM